MSVTVREYAAPPFSVRDALRYAGCRDMADDVAALAKQCFDELREGLRYRVCYAELTVTVTGEKCDFGAFSVTSADLARYLGGCRRVVLFAATVGVAPDRLIQRYSRVSPSKALVMQAVGAERVEALCDAFCETLEGALPSRFSPGYGDLPLAVQKDVLRVLEADRRIGVCLGESLLMSPTKSVTAFVGIKG